MNPYLMAAPYALNAISALGGIFGRQRQYIDPTMLRQRFGPQAIAGDTTALSNFILNSPYGQQLLRQAATGGQQFQTDLAARSASSGFGGGAGASSGASDFAAAAAPQAQGSMETGVKSNITQAAMPIAANFENNLMGIAQEQAMNPMPSTFQKIAAAAGAGGTGAPRPAQASQSGVVGAANVRKPGESAANPGARMGSVYNYLGSM